MHAVLGFPRHAPCKQDMAVPLAVSDDDFSPRHHISSVIQTREQPAEGSGATIDTMKHSTISSPVRGM